MNKNLETEALQYNLSSLIDLQVKRQQNIELFQLSIRKERNASMQEATAQAALEDRLSMHYANIIKLSEEDQELIKRDIPKLKSTQTRRQENIIKLHQAIIEEQGLMDHEVQMIRFLELGNELQK